ncbi:MAG TPA: S-layer homology domain-containing protein [bacterium]|nr:S-layer homology domain-containing protein [bacterium]
MRQCATALATALVLAMIAPAFAQPFADTPTNHWAYDAIAELAAKGLIEGYPDGTFKGDRAMTRYEMAMVVARLLARIESIQIPTPAPAMRPEVGRTDIDTILRLVNEFRAELAAKNVRLTAVEEELNALKARLDNVKITGRFLWRYDGRPRSGGASLNGNPNVGATDASKFATIFLSHEGLKLSVDGSVAPDVHAILGLELASNAHRTPLTFNSSNLGTVNLTNPTGGTTTSPQYVLANIVELFFDWKNIWGTPIELWIGRFGGGVQGFASYPVQFGPMGLLLKTNTNNWGASTGNSGANLADGLRLAGHWAELADLQIQGVIIRVTGPTGSTTYNLGEDAYGIDANIQIMPGVRGGGYYVANTTNAGSTVTVSPLGALYHVYGNLDSPSQDPVTPLCPAVATGALSSTGIAVVQGGITCAAAGSGWGGYVQWDVMPGIHFDGEYAQWTDSVHAISDSAFMTNVAWDLGTLLGVGHNFSVQTGYAYAGTNFYAPYGTDFDDNINGSIFPGDFQGFVGGVSYDLFSNLTLLGQWINGDNVFNGQTVTAWQAGFIYKFAPGTQIWIRYETYSVAGVAFYNLYRAELNYTF